MVVEDGSGPSDAEKKPLESMPSLSEKNCSSAGCFFSLMERGIVLNEMHDRRQAIKRFSPYLDGDELRVDFPLPPTQRGRDAATMVRDSTYSGLSIEVARDSIVSTYRAGVRHIAVVDRVESLRFGWTCESLAGFGQGRDALTGGYADCWPDVGGVGRDDTRIYPTTRPSNQPHRQGRVTWTQPLGKPATAY